MNTKSKRSVNDNFRSTTYFLCWYKDYKKQSAIISDVFILVLDSRSELVHDWMKITNKNKIMLKKVGNDF